MDLEVREIPPQSRGMYSNRMRSYKQEMGKLETDFVSQIRPFVIFTFLKNVSSSCLSQHEMHSLLGSCRRQVTAFILYELGI